jgi:hypothetical protein
MPKARSVISLLPINFTKKRTVNVRKIVRSMPITSIYLIDFSARTFFLSAFIRRLLTNNIAKIIS